jgi:hypothetical protein
MEEGYSLIENEKSELSLEQSIGDPDFDIGNL